MSIDERSKADNAVKVRNQDFLQRQFLGYIDKDIMQIKYNAKKIYYKDWFTFKIISDNGTPSKLECGVDINGHRHRIRYIYDANELRVNNWDENNNEVYLRNMSQLPDKLVPFVLSLFRYLRKAFNKPEPTWVENI